MMQKRIDSFFKHSSTQSIPQSACNCDDIFDGIRAKNHPEIRIKYTRESIRKRESTSDGLIGEEVSEEERENQIVKKSVGCDGKILNKKRKYAQYHLELGQSDFLLHTCIICGFMYAKGDETDDKVHNTFHNNYTHGIPFKGWRRERVIHVPSLKKDRIIVVSSCDPPARRNKVQEVVKMMEIELGDGWLFHERCKVYLFISSQRVAGCMIVEPINTAHKLLSDSMEKAIDGDCVKEVIPKPKTLQFGDICFQREVSKKGSANRSSEAMDSNLLGSIVCEEEATPVSCGIRAIWVSPSNRRKHIATHLLDAVRKNFSIDCVLERSQLAFSLPTWTGKALATKYTGTGSFLLLLGYLTQEPSHELIENTEVGDLLYWKGNTNGKFSISYALQLLRNEDYSSSSPIWDLIWKITVQQQVRAFLWILLHERLLCNSNRVKRQLADDPTCPRCQANDETLLHLFRDCPAARAMWFSIGGAAHYDSFFTGSFQQWVIRNLKAENLIFAENWPTCFAISLGWCWRWRNCITFGKLNEIPIDTGTFLQSRIMETWRAFNEGNLLHSNQAQLNRKEEILIRWQAPPQGWVTLNCDGAAKNSNVPAGGGGLIRDSTGALIEDSVLTLLDNVACVQMLLSDDYGGGECRHLLSACHKLIRENHWIVWIKHCYRESNKAADFLANQGVIQQERLVIFNEASIMLNRLIVQDCMGVSESRLVRVS